MLPAKPQPNHVYFVSFEDYLQPKQPHKKRHLQLCDPKKSGAGLRVKFLEHPALVAGRPSRWRRWWRRLRTRFTSVRTHPVENNPGRGDVPIGAKAAEMARRWQLRTKLDKMRPRWGKWTELPSFLAFLRARNDDGLCKRKSGFEIYCEMASIHGFVFFVGAKTWERVFWSSVILVAILMSALVLTMSHFQTLNTPVIMSTENTQAPAWTIPFPAITICNLNRMSRRHSEELARKFFPHTSFSQQDLLHLFRLSLYRTDHLNVSRLDLLAFQHMLDRNNYTLERFEYEVRPHCAKELLHCKWKGRTERCDRLFQPVETPQGECCSFNYHALPSQKLRDSMPYHTTSCGYKTGLSVLLDPHIDDYMAGLTKLPGYQVLIHDAYDYPADSVERHFIQAHTETNINILPLSTRATEFVSGEGVHSRRCYVTGERRLETFPNYTQTNCLAECRSRMLANKCGCVPMHLPRPKRTPICGMNKSTCVMEHQDILHQILREPNRNYKEDRFAEQFICDCYPQCSYNKYTAVTSAGVLDRSHSFEDARIFQDVQINGHIFLHVYYGDITAELYRLDVYENWLSFIGTFGGIAGLHMGYSFVSGFEVVFFTLVRPLCNWLTKQQIRYRVKRKQRKAAAAAAAAKKAQEEQERKAEDEAKEDTEPPPEIDKV